VTFDAQVGGVEAVSAPRGLFFLMCSELEIFFVVHELHPPKGYCLVLYSFDGRGIAI